ncbi:MAG: tetratricopeptide repeat protein [Bacteroidaceae bacterium]|nr:tetratricopeptide repeat protein [Bacteroidaceae bacterium]
MKSLLLSLFLLISTSVFAQPSAVKNVQKAVFAFITYDKTGNKLGEGNGVFVSTNGEAVAPYKPFVGCSKAVVTDYSGKTFEVKRMFGASEAHNIAHFTIDTKTNAAPVLSTATPQQGTKLYCVGTKQSAKTNEGAVRSVETFLDKYAYYIVKLSGQEGLGGCPFVTEQGQVVGLLEISANTADAYSTDIRYAQSLMPQMFSASDPALAQINIPIQLPANKEAARVVMMMISSQDSLKYAVAAQDFIKAYPTDVDGYPIAAGVELSAGNIANADNIMQQALKNADNKAAANYEFSKLIYTKELYQPEPAYADWSFDKAIEYIKAAEAIDNNALYRNHEAHVLFAQKKYEETDQILSSLIGTKDINQAESYYELARCRQVMGKPNEEIIALLDSAVNHVDSLSITSSAPYFLMRAQVNENLGKYRDAVFDYSRYQIIMQNRVNENFYYTRFNAEVKCKMYQQALADIQNCIILNPQELLYPSEMAQLEIQVNMLDEAVAAAKYCIEIAPEKPVGYTLLALAQAKQGKKDEAKQNFLKSKELGDEKADELMEKYLK